MASYNRVILMGNITRDIELRYTPTGTPVTEVGLAVNDRRKTSAGEWIEETTFVEVTFFGRTAEVASEYLSKGSPVFVEGRLKLDTWEKDGEKKSKLRVICDRMQLIGSKGAGGGESRPARPAGQYAPQAQYAPQGQYAEPTHSDRDGDSGSYGGEEIPF